MKIRVAPDEPMLGPYHKIIKRILWTVALLFALVLALYNLIPLYIYYYVPKELPPYNLTTARRNDDTLSIIVIGDSWAEFHSNLHGDTIFNTAARRIYGKPFKSATRGKGGTTSKEIYYYMFSNQTVEHSYEPDRCTQPLIETRPDYCIIYAGINDAILLRPSYYYTESMKAIIRLLLYNNIRPVVMEIPMFSYEGSIRWRTKKEKFFLLVRGYVMGTWNNDVAFYRQSLKRMLNETRLKDSILYIPTKKWNPTGWKEKDIYVEDGVHLNLKGYHILDSCITSEVTNDYVKRKMTKK